MVDYVYILTLFILGKYICINVKNPKWKWIVPLKLKEASDVKVDF